MCELCLFVPMLSWGRREVGDVMSPVTRCPAWSGAQEESMLQETPNCRSRSLLERICIYRVPPDSRLWQALGSSTAQSGSRLLLSRPPSPQPPSRHVSGPPFLSTAPWPLLPKSQYGQMRETQQIHRGWSGVLALALGLRVHLHEGGSFACQDSTPFLT